MMARRRGAARPRAATAVARTLVGLVVLQGLLSAAAAHGGWTTEAGAELTSDSAAELQQQQRRQQERQEGRSRCTQAAALAHPLSLADVARCIVAGGSAGGSRNDSSGSRAGLLLSPGNSTVWAHVPVGARPAAMRRQLPGAAWLVHTLVVAPKQQGVAWRADWVPPMDAVTTEALAQSAASAAARAGVAGLQRASAFLAANVSVCMASPGGIAQPITMVKREVAGLLAHVGGGFSPRRVGIEAGQCFPAEGGSGSKRLLGRWLSRTGQGGGDPSEAAQVSLYELVCLHASSVCGCRSPSQMAASQRHVLGCQGSCILLGNNLCWHCAPLVSALRPTNPSMCRC